MRNSISRLHSILSICSLFFPMIAIALCLFVSNTPVAAIDSDKSIPEYRIRAAFIYNFIKFVTWPETHSPTDTATVCIIGDAEFASYLPSLHNSVGINVISLVPTGEISSCHILFIGKQEETNASSIVAHAGRNPVLSISEARNFADNGGIIEISKMDKSIGLFSSDRINLRINLKKANSVGLHIDARLLQIATEVIK